MVICPVAIAVGCKKCPIFNVCPVKSVIGDYKPPAEAQPDTKRSASPAKSTTSSAAKSRASKSSTAKARAAKTRGRKK
ncbi:MAG: hypothetical protein ABI777_01600 [Betaproteobacteria bacterium]